MLFLGYLIFGAALWVSVRYALATSGERLLIARLQHLVELAAEEADSPDEVEEELVELVMAAPEGHLARVRDASGRDVIPSRSPAAIPWPEGDGERSLRAVYAEGVPHRVLVQEVTIQGRSFEVLLASSLESLESARDRLAASFLLATPVALVLCSAGGFLIARRALKPLDQIAVAASAITVGSLSRRIEVPPTGDALERLASTFNEMLSRLETSVDRIEQFSADASHELRTPLSVIRTTAELALRHPRTQEEVLSDLKEIHAQAVRLSELTEVLLILSRKDAEDSTVPMVEIDLGAIVASVFREFTEVAESKGLELRLQASDQTITVRGNEASLRRLLASLLENALAYTHSGGVIVSVSRGEEGPLLSVIDTGEGIPGESLERVFDRFYRVDASRSRSTGGYGLGLSIARRIAELHGALISVRSGPREGSCFTVHFPR